MGIKKFSFAGIFLLCASIYGLPIPNDSITIGLAGNGNQAVGSVNSGSVVMTQGGPPVPPRPFRPKRNAENGENLTNNQITDGNTNQNIPSLGGEDVIGDNNQVIPSLDGTNNTAIGTQHTQINNNKGHVMNFEDTVVNGGFNIGSLARVKRSPGDNINIGITGTGNQVIGKAGGHPFSNDKINVGVDGNFNQVVGKVGFGGRVFLHQRGKRSPGDNINIGITGSGNQVIGKAGGHPFSNDKINVGVDGNFNQVVGKVGFGGRVFLHQRGKRSVLDGDKINIGVDGLNNQVIGKISEVPDVAANDQIALDVKGSGNQVIGKINGKVKILQSQDFSGHGLEDFQERLLSNDFRRKRAVNWPQEEEQEIVFFGADGNKLIQKGSEYLMVEPKSEIRYKRAIGFRNHGKEPIIYFDVTGNRLLRKGAEYQLVEPNSELRYKRSFSSELDSGSTTGDNNQIVTQVDGNQNTLIGTQYQQFNNNEGNVIDFEATTVNEGFNVA